MHGEKFLLNGPFWPEMKMTKLDKASMSKKCHVFLDEFISSLNVLDFDTKCVCVCFVVYNYLTVPVLQV